MFSNSAAIEAEMWGPSFLQNEDRLLFSEVEEKAKAFTEAHKGETSEEILSQMRGEKPLKKAGKTQTSAISHQTSPSKPKTTKCTNSKSK